MEKYKPEPVTNTEHVLAYYLSEILEELRAIHSLVSTPKPAPKVKSKPKKEGE